MSDVARPTEAQIAQVRTAAEAVKAAIDAHLAAVEGRAGAGDPVVAGTYEALADAAEGYDELLDSVYDEFTPFEVPRSSGIGLPDRIEPEAVSVLIRRDYTVADPRRLRETVGSSTVSGSLRALFGEYEPDRVAHHASEFGLEEGDSTLWVVANEPVTEPGEWLAEPFDVADEDLLICRFDVIEDYDDELLEPADPS
ncbi:hypothetical protein [Streptacidiphilus jiangxiensis]|uniref:Uncharacterized protein n=1 Tax=Streptacidiphilus jiangxiensis TaxID=235985 RepID=A0A1H7U865_STRJI|nr:hypothetical protein [Streptacidiphilus jiangxiensis]SEL92838.1 hypothetical protein SAMN05414137_115118 [Streptacidiphilus jiangxiensis]